MINIGPIKTSKLVKQSVSVSPNLSEEYISIKVHKRKDGYHFLHGMRFGEQAEDVSTNMNGSWTF